LKRGTGRRNEPYRYWLDGMEEVWQSDPLRLPPLEFEPEDFLGKRRKLADVLADRKSEAEAKAKRASRKRRPPHPVVPEPPADAARPTPAPDAGETGGAP
jgi:hypothetical protein